MDMDDNEFISYCESHSETERSGFVPDHIARMYRLAGNPTEAEAWEARPLNIISVDLRPLCQIARARMK